MLSSMIKGHWASLTTIGAAVIAVVTATLTIEARYAKAAEVTQAKAENKVLLDKVQVEQKIVIETLRKQQLEDRLFELRMKTSPTPAEKAIIKRYEDQLRETTDRINRTATPSR